MNLLVNRNLLLTEVAKFNFKADIITYNLFPP